MQYHRSLQRKAFIAVAILAVLILAIAVPLNINNQLRYDVAKKLNLVPGKNSVQLTDANSNAMLLVVPLDHGEADGTSPWLYRAQFIAWPGDDGMDFENLESGEHAHIPLTSIDFTSANGDGSLVLVRGKLAIGNESGAFTIRPADMHVVQLGSALSAPTVPGDWEPPSWEKTTGICNRPSPNQRFVGCFTRAGAASYLAGDWQFDLQMWGDYEVVKPLYRGMGFLPTVGFAKDDTEVYLQNENGIVRVDVPQNILDIAPAGTPFSSSIATPTP